MSNWRLIVLNNAPAGAGNPLELFKEYVSLDHALAAAREWCEENGCSADLAVADLSRVGARYSELAHVTLVLQPLD